MKLFEYTSPCERFTGQHPNYYILKTFGCLCFPYIVSYNAHKHDNKNKGNWFMDFLSGRIIIYKHVIFCELNYPIRLRLYLIMVHLISIHDFLIVLGILNLALFFQVFLCWFRLLLHPVYHPGMCPS